MEQINKAYSFTLIVQNNSKVQKFLQNYKTVLRIITVRQAVPKVHFKQRKLK